MHMNVTVANCLSKRGTLAGSAWSASWRVYNTASPESHVCGLISGTQLDHQPQQIDDLPPALSNGVVASQGAEQKPFVLFGYSYAIGD